MQKPEVTAYLKTYCGWSAGVRAVLAKYSLPYTEKDIIQNPAFRWEMETKSGQPLSPCVEINGRMLADVSGEEVERYLVENNPPGGGEKKGKKSLKKRASGWRGPPSQENIQRIRRLEIGYERCYDRRRLPRRMARRIVGAAHA